MKKFVKYIFIFAALIFATMSCVQKHAPIQPGDPDVAGCLGVYFPAQTTSFAFEPTDDAIVEIAVSRTNTVGSASVPFKVVDAAGIFSVSDILFDDGQSETTVTVTFPSAEVGTKYTCSFVLEGDDFVSKYSSNPIAIDFSVIIEKWNDLGKGTWFEDGYFTFKAPVPATIMQSDKNKNLYRIYLSEINDEGEVEYFYSDDQDPYLEFRVLQPGEAIGGSKVTKNDLVYFSIFDTGYINTNYGKSIWYCHPRTFPKYASEDTWSYNRVLQYQEDGKTPAAVQLAPYFYMDGVGGWDYSQEDGVITIVFPGAVLVDYSLDIYAGQSEDGVLPIDFEVGKDVAKVKYACFEGTLNVAQVAKQVAAIASGEVESEEVEVEAIEFDDVVYYGASVEVEFEQTGVYTVVAVAYDESGVVQSNASSEFCYLASGDEKAVVVNAGLNVTDKYAPKGYTSENSLEYYIYGKELESVSYGLFNTRDLTSQVAIMDAIASLEEASDDELEAINSDGYSDLYLKLSPGTPYTLIVVASNGYESSTVVVNATTNGDPLPVYMNYDADKIFSYDQPESKSGFFGKYNYYAVDFFGDTTDRVALGQVTITDSDTPSLPEDENGFVTEYININGLFAAEADYFGWEDKMEWMVYGGYIFNTAESQIVGRCAAGYYLRYYVFASGAGSLYPDYEQMLVGGFVEDGHIAFASSEFYNGGTLGEDGLFLRAFADEGFTQLAGNISGYANFLLVDPAKDVTPGALRSANKKASQALSLKKAIKQAPANYVLTREANLRNIIDNFNKENNIKAVSDNNAGFDFVSPDVKTVSFDSKSVETNFSTKKSINHNQVESVDVRIVK